MTREELGESSARYFDSNLREVLIGGHTIHVRTEKVPLTVKVKYAIKRWVIKTRVSLAEWIGGTYLHEYCW